MAGRIGGMWSATLKLSFRPGSLAASSADSAAVAHADCP